MLQKFSNSKNSFLHWGKRTISLERDVLQKKKKNQKNSKETEEEVKQSIKQSLVWLGRIHFFWKWNSNLGPWKSLLTAVQTDNAPPQRGGQTALTSNQQQHLRQHWEKPKEEPAETGVSVLPSTAYSSASGRRSGRSKPQEERTEETQRKGLLVRKKKKSFHLFYQILF